MKFFSWLGVILVILLIIAAITSPSDQKFTDFINNDKGGDTMNCKPITGKTTEIKLLAKIASVKYVSFCETGAPLRLKDKTGDTRTLNYIIPNITRSETYLGLFGRFWKI